MAATANTAIKMTAAVETGLFGADFAGDAGLKITT